MKPATATPAATASPRRAGRTSTLPSTMPSTPPNDAFAAAPQIALEPAHRAGRLGAVPTAWCTLESPLGDLWVAATDQGLSGLWFVGQRHGPTPLEQAGWPTAAAAAAAGTTGQEAQGAAQGWLLEAAQQLQAYWAEALPFDLRRLPLDWRSGTAFQRRVWQALLLIGPGETWSYGALARHLALPQAARAVGSAVGRNPWSLLVPCHRVLGQSGALTGYAGGLERKRWLLRHEVARAAPQSSLVPAGDAANTAIGAPV